MLLFLSSATMPSVSLEKRLHHLVQRHSSVEPYQNIIPFVTIQAQFHVVDGSTYVEQYGCNAVSCAKTLECISLLASCKIKMWFVMTANAVVNHL